MIPKEVQDGFIDDSDHSVGSVLALLEPEKLKIIAPFVPIDSDKITTAKIDTAFSAAVLNKSVVISHIDNDGFIIVALPSGLNEDTEPATIFHYEPNDNSDIAGQLSDTAKNMILTLFRDKVISRKDAVATLNIIYTRNKYENTPADLLPTDLLVEQRNHELQLAAITGMSAGLIFILNQGEHMSLTEYLLLVINTALAFRSIAHLAYVSNMLHKKKQDVGSQ